MFSRTDPIAIGIYAGTTDGARAGQLRSRWSKDDQAVRHAGPHIEGCRGWAISAIDRISSPPRHSSVSHGNTARPAPPLIASEGGTNGQSKGCRRAADSSARYADRPAPQRRAGDLRRAQYPARRHVRALPKDQELPLACLRTPLPRLSSPPRRAGRTDFRDHRRHRRARAQDWRHHTTFDRPHRPLAARAGQRRRLRHAVGYACRTARRQQATGGELARGPRDLRRARGRGASLIENWIDEAERRTWFLFEATRVARE